MTTEPNKLDEILFGVATHPALLIAHTILTAELSLRETGQAARRKMRRLLEHPQIIDCQGESKVYATIIEAAFHSCPLYADCMADEAHVYFASEASRIPKAPAGLVLGILRAVKRLDDENVSGIYRWHRGTFIPNICAIFKLLVFGDTVFVDEKDSISRQQGQLGSALAALVLSDKEDNVGTRRSQVANMLAEIEELVPIRGLSPFGKFFVGELSFKVFGTLSAEGQLSAVVGFYRKWVGVPVQPPQPVEPKPAEPAGVVKLPDTPAFEG